jgi:hypothetical protein
MNAKLRTEKAGSLRVPTTPSEDDGLGIPEFLRRTNDVPSPVVAKQALAKLNGSSKPAVKALSDAEHALSSSDFAEHMTKSIAKPDAIKAKIKAGIEAKDTAKTDLAQKLSAATGHDAAALKRQFREAHYRVAVEKVRDDLVARYPDKAATIKALMSDGELRKIWQYGKPK